MNHLPTIIQRTLIFLNIFVFLILSSAKGHCINHTAPENESGAIMIDTPNITGTVADINGNPIAGAIVSDGKNIVLTDSTGFYSMNSDKTKGTVWVSIPRGYEPPISGSSPQFFASLTRPKKVAERHDFVLTPIENPDSYALLVHTDQHLTGRPTGDIEQFRSFIIPDFNSTIAQYRAQGKHVYSISLGDAGWEKHWVEYSFGLPDVACEFDRIECPVFSVIGNHDYNPYVSGDTNSTDIFRKNFGPTYYSFNLGRIHYIVLDDIVYINANATPTEMGDRDYRRRLDADQLRWLKADLATLPTTSEPIVICSHIPFYSAPALNDNGSLTVTNSLRNVEEIEEILRPYNNIKVFTGHHHRAYNVESPRHKGITEWVYPAICATMWRTKQLAGNHITADGCIGGYGIWTVDSTDMSYRYKSPGYPADYQMRVYDLNTVLINAKLVSNKAAKSKVAKCAHGYNKRNKRNELLINVFAYGPGWKVEARENGLPLKVEQVAASDPLHILSYEIAQLNNGEHNAHSKSNPSIHFFKATASAPDTQVTVTVTDPWGHIYTETVERPKAFHKLMK